MDKWHTHFSEEDLQMVNKHLKTCSVLLPIRKMQIKAAMRYYYILIIKDKT